MNKKRKNQLAIHSICEFVFSVPDLQQAYDFYNAFGLEVKNSSEGYLELYTYGCAHRWARIYQDGDKKQLKWLSFGIYAEDFEAIQQHIISKNIPMIAALDDQAKQSFWIEGPDSLPLQIMVTDKVSPDFKSQAIHPLTESLVGRAPNRKLITQVHPSYLSHLSIFATDVEATVSFYVNVLGLRISDQSRGIVAFLHGAHGSDHHLLAIAKSNGSGLHHSSWNVDQIDDIGLGKQQMEQAGYDQGWGMGRHVLGSNYFHYVRDPWGSYAEYSHDIDFVAHDHDWPAADHPVEDSMFVWGPNPPKDFIINYETI
ncbi:MULTISPECIES: VOC family protein [unclassified Acinetobacter]|uniref:VOC family protein n=1 Tax=unclassified Acinetobacter TaxID=196816 RepID=UPI00190D6A64|nr:MULTISPECIES: VOC family protein [unclassified Acinetobacter]MBK0062455.1 VOC family protein [Acinetobacter sp. S55]MBK0066259.1 VOC family protein [Acinetobacter sp. S54]